jgi:NAD(P)-dependent dehydrogenase (short-subunit alcohol dehydrogenase family)
MTNGARNSSLQLGLTGKAAVVTGAGAGIGQGVARGLARAGVQVGLVDIDTARAAFTAELIAKEGGEGLPLPADVMDTGALTAAIGTAHRALELAERGIRVNAIAPDHTATAGNHGMRTGPADPDTLPPRPQAQQEAVGRYVPLGREGDVSECADAVVFLCSDRASYISGVTLSVDGGAAALGWVRAGGGWSLYGDGIPLNEG